MAISKKSLSSVKMAPSAREINANPFASKDDLFEFAQDHLITTPSRVSHGMSNLKADFIGNDSFFQDLIDDDQFTPIMVLSFQNTLITKNPSGTGIDYESFYAGGATS